MLRFNPEYNYVLVEHGKHGDNYFPAATPEEFAASCFMILKERVESGYWYDEWDLSPKPKGMVDSEHILELPEGPVRDVAAKLYNNWMRGNRQSLVNNMLVTEAKRIVAEYDFLPKEVRRKSNGDLLGYETPASRVLSKREGYEYEQVTLERLVAVQTPSPTPSVPS